MENSKLIQNLEKVSLNIPDRILKVKGYVINNREKEDLEIIIYKGFSSSTTHKIDIDADKNILNLKCFFTSYELFEAPLSEINNKFLKETKSFKEISNENFWA